MKMLSLLKGVGSQIQLKSPLGRWMEAVSSMLDGITSAYIEVRRTASDQSVNFTNGDDIILNLVSGGGTGVGYDTTTGIFTLQSAGLYELEFYGTWVNFGTPNGTAASVDWVDLAGNPLVIGHSSWGVSSSSTLNNASQAATKVIYSAAAGAQVKLKSSATGGGGTADLLRGASFAIVRKIG